jgi:hypothetical protein
MVDQRIVYVEQNESHKMPRSPVSQGTWGAAGTQLFVQSRAMLSQIVDGGLDVCTVSREYGLPSGPTAVAFGHQPRIGADFPDRHTAGAEVSKKGDPLRVTGAVGAVTARGIALHQWDEPRSFVVP